MAYSKRIERSGHARDAMNCTSSRECIDLHDGHFFKCYIAPTWTKKKNFCDCPTSYNFEGENCDEVSSTVLVYRFFVILDLIIVFSLILRLMPEMMKTRLILKDNPNKRKLPTALIWTRVLAMAASFFRLFQFILALPVAFDASLQELTIRENGAEAFAFRNVDLYLAASGVAVSLQMFSFVQVGFSWIRVAESMSVFSKSAKPKLERIFHAFRFMVSVAMLSLLVAFLVAISTDAPEMGLKIIASYILFICFFLYLGRREFLKVVAGDKISKKIRKMKIASGGLIFWVFFCFITTLVYKQCRLSNRFSSAWKAYHQTPDYSPNRVRLRDATFCTSMVL